VFTDFGSLWGNDQEGVALTPAQLAITGGVQPKIVDSTAIRVAAGFGVSWKSPLGPIRLDLAYPIKKESFDKTQLFHVSFGTRF
jgi:outer membrane protein insertion porin family